MTQSEKYKESNNIHLQLKKKKKTAKSIQLEIQKKKKIVQLHKQQQIRSLNRFTHNKKSSPSTYKFITTNSKKKKKV